LRALAHQRLNELVGSYVDAWERGDIDALVAMLTQDARITMPPIPTWFTGQEAVRAFLAGHVLDGDRPRRLLPVIANGQPAFGQYRWDDTRRRLQAYAITVLTLDGGRIQEITAFLDAQPFARFGS
jgi:RNA polymerase sigma-70 factor (ECF subfamily)